MQYVFPSNNACNSIHLIYLKIVIQAVCDHRSIFTEFDMGWPGSVQDTAVFKESDLWRKKSQHFDDDEYILADKGL